jgi:hypothetical protein
MIRTMDTTNIPHHESSLIPIVPYESYEEYEALLKSLVEEYQDMVAEGVRLARMERWCRWHEGLSFEVQSHWGHHGIDLFLKLTKGQGKEWCDTMSTMVLQALDTAVRVMVMTREEMGIPMLGTENDRHRIAALLKRETALFFYNHVDGSELEDRNFEAVYLSDYWHNYDDEKYRLGKFTIAHIQNMKLAFAMVSHKRLGDSAAGRVLSCDLMRNILVNAWNSSD